MVLLQFTEYWVAFWAYTSVGIALIFSDCRVVLPLTHPRNSYKCSNINSNHKQSCFHWTNNCSSYVSMPMPKEVTSSLFLSFYLHLKVNFVCLSPSSPPYRSSHFWSPLTHGTCLLCYASYPSSYYAWSHSCQTIFWYPLPFCHPYSSPWYSHIFWTWGQGIPNGQTRCFVIRQPHTDIHLLSSHPLETTNWPLHRGFQKFSMYSNIAWQKLN